MPVQLQDALTSKEHLEEQLAHVKSAAEATEQLAKELVQQRDQLQAQGA
jgi:GTP1/Obg family GTP-binding protein